MNPSIRLPRRLLRAGTDETDEVRVMGGGVLSGKKMVRGWIDFDAKIRRSHWE